MTRITAISKTFYHQVGAANDKRFMAEALSLTAACVWLANGLHARPEDGPAARRLMDAVLPVTEADGVSREVLAYNTSVRGEERGEEEEEEEDVSSSRRVPYNPYGCVFFRRLKLGDAPRLRVGGPVLSPPAFKFWFNGLSIEEITAKYQTTGIVDRTALAHKRPSNKGKMPLYVNGTGAPEPDLFNLSAHGHTLPPPAGDGSDMDDNSSSRSASPTTPTIDTFLSKLWRQFVMDLTRKSPNPRGATNPAYLKLTDIQRQQGKEDIYKNPVLSDVFNGVAYRSGSRDDWERAFKWLFPLPGHKTTNATQNYPTCPYYNSWLAFIGNPNHNETLIKDARQAIWKRLRKWSWIPDAQQDKMWPTTSISGFTRWPPSKRTTGRKEAAPRVLLRHGEMAIFEAEVTEL